MGALLSALSALFWSSEMEIAVLGLQGAGKSSFVSVLNTGEAPTDLMPTIGFNMHKVKRGGVLIKVWDLGGQEKFRSMWERYCRGVTCIVYVVDLADAPQMETARAELDSLLCHTSLSAIPLLFLFNKNDLREALSLDTALQALAVSSIRNRTVAYYSISCKSLVNIDKAVQWLTQQAKNKH